MESGKKHPSGKAKYPGTYTANCRCNTTITRLDAESAGRQSYFFKDAKDDCVRCTKCGAAFWFDADEPQEPTTSQWIPWKWYKRTGYDNGKYQNVGRLYQLIEPKDSCMGLFSTNFAVKIESDYKYFDPTPHDEPENLAVLPELKALHGHLETLAGRPPKRELTMGEVRKAIIAAGIDPYGAKEHAGAGARIEASARAFRNKQLSVPLQKVIRGMCGQKRRDESVYENPR